MKNLKSLMVTKMLIDLQFFAEGDKGQVYPVHNNKFFICTTGRTGEADTIIRGLENFAPAIDGNVESWTPMDEGGWTRNQVTGKGLTLGFSGKRQYGDAGNDYIAGLMTGTGVAVQSKFKWEMPSGATLTGDCVINVTTPAGGDSTNIDTLEFELLSDGKPTFTPATPAGSV